ncbi:hypothetical protein ACFUTR_32440 [Streptomyces sp. NPDC057367]|uniref:hypothetical protein n=1 Tax=Streptomyces sp. NPDC057367 TaxID=3346108 RepID=UPI00362E5B06
MTTTDGEPVEFAGVRVEPVISEAADHGRQLLSIVSAVIAGASSAYGRDRPNDFPPPESAVIARESGSQPFDLAKPLSLRIERFMLLVRLLRPGTSESMAEVQGETARSDDELS